MKPRPTIQARPTLYKGIQMRSRLEADFAGALDRDGYKWEYEPTCFAGPDGQWLPDFYCDEIGDGVYIEVKPASLATFDTFDTPAMSEVINRVDKVLRKMSVAWLSKPAAYVELIFWTYGLPDRLDAPLRILGSHEHKAGPPVWLAYTPTNREVPLLWPGMGQMDAAYDRDRGSVLTTAEGMLWTIRDNRTLSYKAKIVWIMLLSRGEECCPSVAAIAADCLMAKSTARAAILELAGSGWLKVSSRTTAGGRDRDTNLYLVICPGRDPGPEGLPF